ncbi:4-(cytidine 5'-diphospho)-2-C-methyl-D-erythritol kinase [Marinicauda salina]|uniref:4-diphosphocytidyl-2-C-methyl-D-erythritol kinase n=1 Tax=Marinicauda salina TaxID=2135793 RepID=A0A2U2BUB2_9PROT|nr:4-(cytidine 5'-diphospho)-2-C-methyl-D-erythritol kinase [Marinicauda salina]PWE17621.1 4-(cytidine 5'-diphospho)-2-C-methyl-D-erythritol kinase [Marinicauda salina]
MSAAGPREPAPAKVNLTLRVGRARPDGYHPLDSLVVFADWGDEVQTEEADSLTLTIEGDGAEALADETHNLVLKAAWALRAAVERPELAAQITLEKRLPVAAGLGGGSADAAAALRALNRLWDLDLTRAQLAEIASVVGADAPACVYSRPLRMTGIGDRIAPLAAWPTLDAVLLHPGEAVSTARVFAAFDEDAPEPLAGEARTPAAGDFETALAVIEQSANDLEPAAKRLAPVIGDALDALSTQTGARLARMSGSGATCFALFADADAARAAASALDGAQAGWRARAVRLGGAA